MTDKSKKPTNDLPKPKPEDIKPWWMKGRDYQ